MITIKVNRISNLIDNLSRLEKGVEDKTPLMRSIAGSLQSAVDRNFDKGGRPKWLGLKYRKGQPLIKSSELRTSIKQDYGKHHAQAGTNLPYAAIHNFGGLAGRGKKVKIPARPFMRLTPADEDDIAQDVQTYFRTLI